MCGFSSFRSFLLVLLKLFFLVCDDQWQGRQMYLSGLSLFQWPKVLELPNFFIWYRSPVSTCWHTTDFWFIQCCHLEVFTALPLELWVFFSPSILWGLDANLNYIILMMSIIYIQEIFSHMQPRSWSIKVDLNLYNMLLRCCYQRLDKNFGDVYSLVQPSSSFRGSFRNACTVFSTFFFLITDILARLVRLVTLIFESLLCEVVFVLILRRKKGGRLSKFVLLLSIAG